MYAYPPPQKDPGRDQAKMIVNLVVVVFLVIGLLLVLQYFNFIFLRDVPIIGNWLMDTYEHVFGVPQVLILHGDDSVGNWVALRDLLSRKLVFYSEDIDVTRYGAGIEYKLKQYGLVIVEDARRLDKDKLLNLLDYVKAGGNIIWVGDAGTNGIVEYDGRIIANQTGWVRDFVCIDDKTLSSCDCKTVNKTSSCKYMPEGAEQKSVDLTSVLGVTFLKNIVSNGVTLEIVDNDHWAVAGIKRRFDLANVTRITSVTNEYSTALVANVLIGDSTYTGVIVNDPPGSWGNVVYFSYPPEETPEILLPLIERLRY